MFLSRNKTICFEEIAKCHEKSRKVSTAFRVFTNIHECLYNSMKAHRKMYHVWFQKISIPTPQRGRGD